MPTSQRFVDGPGFMRPLNSVSSGRPPTPVATVTVTWAAAVSEKLTVVAMPVPSEAGVIVAGDTDKPVTSVLVGVTGPGLRTGTRTGTGPGVPGVAAGGVAIGLGAPLTGIGPPIVPWAG